MYVVVTIATTLKDKELVHVYGPYKTLHYANQDLHDMRQYEKLYYSHLKPDRFFARPLREYDEQTVLFNSLLPSSHKLDQPTSEAEDQDIMYVIATIVNGKGKEFVHAYGPYRTEYLAKKDVLRMDGNQKPFYQGLPTGRSVIRQPLPGLISGYEVKT
jgi:hypothetical protein